MDRPIKTGEEYLAEREAQACEYILAIKYVIDGKYEHHTGIRIAGNGVADRSTRLIKEANEGRHDE